jgi:hypothetical protein
MLQSECSKPWTYGKEAFELPAAGCPGKVSLVPYRFQVAARQLEIRDGAEAPAQLRVRL